MENNERIEKIEQALEEIKKGQAELLAVLVELADFVYEAHTVDATEI